MLFKQKEASRARHYVQYIGKFQEKNPKLNAPSTDTQKYISASCCYIEATFVDSLIPLTCDMLSTKYIGRLQRSFRGEI